MPFSKKIDDSDYRNLAIYLSTIIGQLSIQYKRKIHKEVYRGYNIGPGKLTIDNSAPNDITTLVNADF